MIDFQQAAETEETPRPGCVRQTARRVRNAGLCAPAHARFRVIRALRIHNPAGIKSRRASQVPLIFQQGLFLDRRFQSPSEGPDHDLFRNKTRQPGCQSGEGDEGYFTMFELYREGGLQ